MNNKANKMKYYVYEHYLDNKLFYIGKGCNKRAYNFEGRSINWYNKVLGRENDVVVKIIAYFENEEDAYLFEKLKINTYIEKEGSLENVVYNNNRKKKDFKREKEIFNKRKANILNSVKISECINHAEQIRPKLRQFTNKFSKHKGVAFTPTISGMKLIEKIVIEEGFKPLLLWSVANNKHKLTETQLVARQKIILTNKIPEPYNFLIISSAMREDLILKDEKIRLVIMNTTNIADFAQIKKRIKNDIDVLIYRGDKGETEDLHFIIPEKWLNIPLTTELKIELCKDLGHIDEKGRLMKWRKISQILKNKGYQIENKQKTIDDSRVKVSIISSSDTE